MSADVNLARVDVRRAATTAFILVLGVGSGGSAAPREVTPTPDFALIDRIWHDFRFGTVAS